MQRTLLTLGLLLALTVTTGCGEKGPGLIPVTGKITYGGGDWPKPGNVNFNAVEPAEGFSRLNGTAELATDGTFTVKSTGTKMGLMPGKYMVMIECWEEMPSMETNTAGKSYVPADFPPQEVVIAVGDKKKEVTFDVPKKG